MTTTLAIPTPFDQVVLDFVEFSTVNYLTAFEKLYKRGVRRYALAPLNSTSIDTYTELRKRFPDAVHATDSDEPPQATLLFDTRPDALSAELMKYVDSPRNLVAPITSNYYRNRPIFLTTIPKSGTHLMCHLLGEMGIAPGGQLRGGACPGHYYFLFHEHSHLSLNLFFRKLANEPLGGAKHVFFDHPAIFMYRHPLDLVVSETFHYIDPAKTALAHYFKQFPDPAERLLTLIDDNPVIESSLRDRMMVYAGWLRFDNVIAISYEELVGEQGGGSTLEQCRSIWSMQLKLHVPGNPKYFGNLAYNTGAATFRKGQIGSRHEIFDERHWRAARELPSDYLLSYGYSTNELDGLSGDERREIGRSGWSRFVDEFRRRPLRFREDPPAASDSKAEAPPPPRHLLEYRGYYIGFVRGRYCAVPKHAGPIDPRKEVGLPHLYLDTSVRSIVASIDNAPWSDDRELRELAEPPLTAVFE